MLPRCASRLGADPTTQRGIARDLVGAVGTDEHDPLVQEVASEVLEEIPRRRIAPVKVVEAHEDRTVGAELADEGMRQREHVTDAPGGAVAAQSATLRGRRPHR